MRRHRRPPGKFPEAPPPGSVSGWLVSHRFRTPVNGLSRRRAVRLGVRKEGNGAEEEDAATFAEHDWVEGGADTPAQDDDRKDPCKDSDGDSNQQTEICAGQGPSRYLVRRAARNCVSPAFECLRMLGADNARLTRAWQEGRECWATRQRCRGAGALAPCFACQ
jgi:hypothetical protein